jgi:hypothetical protein
MTRIIQTATLLWIVLLVVILIIPHLTQSESLADDLTRNTVRLSLLYYAAAVSLMLVLQPNEWNGRIGRGWLTRWLWTLAWAAYLVHLAMAFQHIHHWSHDAAVRHTEEASGFGPGIYVSHCFTVVWTADVLYWWLWPERYARRSVWVGGLLHGFMGLVIFNATVVFETGWIRWAGTALFAELSGVWLYQYVVTRPNQELIGRRNECQRQNNFANS